MCERSGQMMRERHFHCRYKDQTIYHAGDLNWWHWEGQRTEYNKNMRRSYQSEINKLCGEKRLMRRCSGRSKTGEQYCLGIDCFMNERNKEYFRCILGKYDVCNRLMLEECTKRLSGQDCEDQRGQTFLWR